MPTATRWFVGTAMVWLSLAHPATARADDERLRAKETFDEAARAFERRRYAEAATAYEHSAALSPHAAPWINAAAAWELDGNFVRAARACDEARALAKDDASRADIDRRLARLTRRVATLQVNGDPHLTIRVDRSVTVSPPGRLRLSPGAHTFELVDAADGTVRAEDATLAEGEERHLVLAKAQWTETRKDDGGARPSAGGLRGPPTASWIAFGVGAAAGVGAALFGAATLNARDDYDARPTLEGADRFDRNLRATNALWGVAGAAVVVAGVVWIFAPRASTAPAKVGALRLVF